MARKLPIYATSSDDKSFKVGGLRAICNCQYSTLLSFLQVWQLDKKEPLQVVKGHHDWLRAIAVSSDAGFVVVGGYDASISIFNVASGDVGLKGGKG